MKNDKDPSCTHDEFIEVLKNLQPTIFKSLMSARISLSRIAELIALECFLKKPEMWDDDNVISLRHHLNLLHNTGVFGFKATAD